MAMSFFEDLKVYREGLLAQGFWALQVYRFGHLRYRFQSKLVRVPLGIAHVILSKLIEIGTGITIGVTAKIGKRLIIEHCGAIVVHGCTEMGDDCIIRQGVTFGIKNIDRPFDAPVLGNRVNVGAGAKLLGKIHIGDDVDVGANAVVVTDVPANHIAVGIPARIKPKKPTTSGQPTT
ncbi:serine O-acetyltransferase [Derxia lacustris]|uniref:serine O-acetyltransferase n=1 Tax=Derxia lacustris TaxID=764842 RepID=UPI000A170D5E|nr:serine acetyltransferase [Derxia lacustris]